MVSGNTSLHKILDQRYRRDQRARAVQSAQSIPSLFQRQQRVQQEPGESICVRKPQGPNTAQYWRLATSFIYFGPLNLDLAFHLFFLSRYARLLEEASGRSPARFSWMLVFAGVLLLCLSPTMHMMFLGPPLVSVLVYVWGRRNPDVELTFLGLFSFKAPFLPWFFMAFGFAAHGDIPKDEICGVIIGHSESLC
jgi:hypothetical protein